MKSVKELVSNRAMHTIKCGTSVFDTAKFMSEQNIGLVPILDGEKLVGVFSERDLMKRVVIVEKDFKSTFVEEVMTKDLVIAKSDESYELCLKKMKEAKIRHILIVEDDNLLGVLSLRDLLEVDLLIQKETVEVLNNYIYSR